MMKSKRESFTILALVLISLPLISGSFTLGKKNVYVKEYEVRMKISPSDMCINVDDICRRVADAIASGDTSTTTTIPDDVEGSVDASSSADASASGTSICEGIKSAVASLHGYYSVRAKIRVSEDRNGNINNVKLKALAQSGAIALTSSYTNITAEGFSDSGNEEELITADADASAELADGSLASATGSTEGFATAFAASLAESSARGGAGATASQFAGVFVKGKQIKRFGGYLYTVTGAFSETKAASSTNLETTSIVQLVSSALTLNGGLEAEAFAEAVSDAVAQVVADAVAKALGRMVVKTFVYANVKDTKKGAKVELYGDGEFAPHISLDCQEPQPEEEEG